MMHERVVFYHNEKTLIEHIVLMLVFGYNPHKVSHNFLTVPKILTAF